MHFKLPHTAFTTLEVRTSDIPPGEYRFGVYRWSKQGVKPDEQLVAIASDPLVEEQLFSLLPFAKTCTNASPVGPAGFDILDGLHYAKWSVARANHEVENRQLVECRIHSLTVSHQARCKAIGDQLSRATNDKIRLMKQSELDRANADFARRNEQLKPAASSGDIHAVAVLFGKMVVKS